MQSLLPRQRGPHGTDDLGGAVAPPLQEGQHPALLPLFGLLERETGKMPRQKHPDGLFLIVALRHPLQHPVDELLADPPALQLQPETDAETTPRLQRRLGKTLGVAEVADPVLGLQRRDGGLQVGLPELPVAQFPLELGNGVIAGGKQPQGVAAGALNGRRFSTFRFRASLPWQALPPPCARNCPRWHWRWTRSRRPSGRSRPGWSSAATPPRR